MGIKIYTNTKLKMAATQTWIEYIIPVQKMIDNQELDNAWQYFDEDITCYGPGEFDVLKGKEAMYRIWRENADLYKVLKWDEPFMDGETGVRRGNVDEWHFECRIKTENNKIKECVTTTIANPDQIPEIKGKKAPISETWLEYIDKVQEMCNDLKLDDVWQYCHEDMICYGPEEDDVFQGKENFFRLWRENNEVNKQMKWEKPFKDGETFVRRGNLDLWHFECRAKTTEDNLVKEYVFKTIDNPHLMPNIVR